MPIYVVSSLRCPAPDSPDKQPHDYDDEPPQPDLYRNRQDALNYIVDQLFQQAITSIESETQDDIPEDSPIRRNLLNDITKYIETCYEEDGVVCVVGLPNMVCQYYYHETDDEESDDEFEDNTERKVYCSNEPEDGVSEDLKEWRKALFDMEHDAISTRFYILFELEIQ